MDEHDVDFVHDAQFRDEATIKDWVDLQIATMQYQIKLFIDWFVVQYYPLITKRCRLAAKYNINKSDWQDLRSECVLEAYEIGKRFDPTKGDLLQFLITSLWNHPFRNDYVREMTPQAQGDFGVDWPLIDHCADEPNSKPDCGLINFNQLEKDCSAREQVDSVYINRQPSFDEICQPIAEHEKTLLQLKFGCNMTNVSLAAYMGTNESTIRYWLDSAYKKILRDKTVWRWV